MLHRKPVTAVSNQGSILTGTLEKKETNHENKITYHDRSVSHHFNTGTGQTLAVPHGSEARCAGNMGIGFKDDTTGRKVRAVRRGR